MQGQFSHHSPWVLSGGWQSPTFWTGPLCPRAPAASYMRQPEIWKCNEKMQNVEDWTRYNLLPVGSSKCKNDPLALARSHIPYYSTVMSPGRPRTLLSVNKKNNAMNKTMLTAQCSISSIKSLMYFPTSKCWAQFSFFTIMSKILRGTGISLPHTTYS